MRAWGERDGSLVRKTAAVLLPLFTKSSDPSLTGTFPSLSCAPVKGNLGNYVGQGNNQMCLKDIISALCGAVGVLRRPPICGSKQLLRFLSPSDDAGELRPASLLCGQCVCSSLDTKKLPRVICTFQ